MNEPTKVVMLGASGAVGQAVLASLFRLEPKIAVTSLGRRSFHGYDRVNLRQSVVDIAEPESYAHQLSGHQHAICTLGVGQPSTMGREAFVQIDKTAVLLFAQACKSNGIQHFQLLGSIGADPRSGNFFLRTKGELESALKAMQFDRLSLFQPSMILTPSNRYGWRQALTLAIWPKLTWLLQGRLTRFRGIPVDELGVAMGANVLRAGQGVEVLQWSDFQRLVNLRKISEDAP